MVRSLGADHVVDYTKEDFTRAEQRYDVILDNVMNHPPFATARVLTPTGLPIPNSFGNAGGWLAGLPRMARATLMGRGSTRVQSVTCEVNGENLAALATLLESGDARRVIDHLYALERRRERDRSNAGAPRPREGRHRRVAGERLEWWRTTRK